MRISVLSMTLFSLGACAHHSDSLAGSHSAPLPALSVQRQLELKVGYDDGSVTGIVRPEAMIEVVFRLSKREAVRLGRQLLRAGEGKRTGGLGTLSTTRGD